jgi:predicted esterase YcpF (UPF0227 family)
MPPLIIYIHGFMSSSLSAKAEETRLYIAEQKLDVDFIAPQLSDYPLPMFEQLQQIIEQRAGGKIGLVGSSLGGFMATVLAEHYDLRAVVINPAVNPDQLMAARLGEHQNPYTGVSFTLEPKHVEHFQQLVVGKLSKPENLWVLLQTGDETLDYRLAVDYYHGCPQTVEQGGNHRFENYQQHLAEVIKFLALDV